MAHDTHRLKHGFGGRGAVVWFAHQAGEGLVAVSAAREIDGHAGRL